MNTRAVYFILLTGMFFLLTDSLLVVAQTTSESRAGQVKNINVISAVTRSSAIRPMPASARGVPGLSEGRRPFDLPASSQAVVPPIPQLPVRIEEETKGLQKRLSRDWRVIPSVVEVASVPQKLSPLPPIETSVTARVQQINRIRERMKEQQKKNETPLSQPPTVAEVSE